MSTRLWLVAGVLQGQEKGTLSPAFRLENVTPSAIQPGPYFLEFLQDGQLLYTLSFMPTQAIPADEIGKASLEEKETGGFYFYVNAPDATDTIVLKYEDTLLHTLTAGPSSPSIENLTSEAAYPEDNSLVEQNIRWNAQDADGDELTFAVRYSTGTEGDWQFLALNLRQPPFTWQSTGGDNGIIEVLASDGIHTGAAHIQLMETAPQPPSVQILSPTDQSIYQAGEPLLLLGEGYDAQGSLIPDAEMVWQIGDLGEVGRGQTVQLDAGLSGGTHKITLVGTDSNGQSGMDAITVTIPSPEDAAIPAMTPTATSATPINEDELLGVLDLNGGIIGFCASLEVYVNGRARYSDSCTQEALEFRLGEATVTYFLSIAEQYDRIQVVDTGGDGPDALSQQFVFNGWGSNAANEEEKDALQDRFTSILLEARVNAGKSSE